MEIALYLIIVIACLPFIIRWMAEEDLKTGKEPKFFVFPTTNMNKYVEKGGTKDESGKWSGGIFVRTIPETPGFILERGVSRPANPGEVQSIPWYNIMFYKTIGVYFYGIYPFRHIKIQSIPIAVDRVEGTGPEDWIDTSRKTELASGIRNQFPRPFVFTEVELGDGLSVDLKLVPTFRVVVPYIPAYRYPNGGFFIKSASLLQSMVMDRLKEVLTLGDFKGKPKGELKGLLADFIAPKGVDTDGNEIPSDLNAEMIRQVGLTMESIGINDWRASSPEVRKALEASGMANATGDANIVAAEKARKVELINAERDAQALTIRTKADVDRQNALAESHHNYIRRTVVGLVLPGSDPNVASRGGADIIEMEAAAGKDSKLTTLVKDRQAIVVPVGGDKK